MKKILHIVAIALIGAMPMAEAVMAQGLPSFTRSYDSRPVDGRVIESYPIYKAGATTTRRVCEDVEVPIYKRVASGNQTGDVVAGAIVGGILGKAVTGKNQGAVAGAIIGGAAASNATKRRIVGYKIERQCHVVEDASNSIKYYESRVRIEGRIYRLRTGNPMIVGDTIRMYMPN